MSGELHLVGSIPLDTPEDVFRTFGKPLGKYLFAMPDGEVGPRRHWISRVHYQVLAAHPELEVVQHPAPDENGVERQHPRNAADAWWFKVRDGVDRVRRSASIIPCSNAVELSNNIIQKGLAFVREESGTVTVPGARRASGSCPAGCLAEVGLWWWRRQMAPHQRNGGSRWEDSPIPNSSFCPQLRGAMIAELTCRETSRPKRRINLSALGC